MPLLAYLIALAVGVALNPGGFFEGLADFLSEPGGWYALSQALFLPALVMYTSVLLRRGALAVAIVAWLVGQQMLFGFWAPSAGFVGLTVAGVVLTICFCNLTVRRLRTLAAESS